jgi:hypothetical protein
MFDQVLESIYQDLLRLVGEKNAKGQTKKTPSCRVELVADPRNPSTYTLIISSRLHDWSLRFDGFEHETIGKIRSLFGHEVKKVFEPLEEEDIYLGRESPFSDEEQENIDNAWEK